MPTVCAYHLYYLSMPTIYAYYLYLPVCATCLCLPSMPTVYTYLSVLPVYTYHLYLPFVPPVYCLYLPVCNLGERSTQSKALPDSIDRLIVLIWIVLYGRSLAVHSNGGRLGCLPRRLWFDSATGRYQSSGSIQSIDWLNRSWCSLAGRLNGRLVLVLVLATVVWFWRRSSGFDNGRLVLTTVLWLPFWCLLR